MPHEQPPGVPPQQWLPRTDAGARKLIDRIDDLADKLDVVDQKVGFVEARASGWVTWERLTLLLGTAAAVIIGGAWTAAKASAEAKAKELEARFELVAQELRAAKRAQEEGLLEVRRDVRALYEATPRKTKQQRLERPPDGGGK